MQRSGTQETKINSSPLSHMSWLAMKLKYCVTGEKLTYFLWKAGTSWFLRTGQGVENMSWESAEVYCNLTAHGNTVTVKLSIQCQTNIKVIVYLGHRSVSVSVTGLSRLIEWVCNRIKKRINKGVSQRQLNRKSRNVSCMGAILLD